MEICRRCGELFGITSDKDFLMESEAVSTSGQRWRSWRMVMDFMEAG